MKSKTLLISLLMAFTFYTSAQDLPIKDTSKTISVSAEIQDRYTGHYRIEAISLVIEISREENKLFVTIAGMRKVPLSAGSSDSFFNNDLQAQIKFPNHAGKTERLILYQAGQQLTGLRINPPKELIYEKIVVGTQRLN